MTTPRGALVDVTDIARWQFGIITVYHFLFVRITIGLSALVAATRRRGCGPATQCLRCDEVLRQAVPDQLRDRRGDRHRAGVPVRHELERLLAFVGDVFGAPLAIEGLLAFFLESTFLGLWIFGWDGSRRGCTRLHLAGRTSGRCSRRTSSWPPTRGCSTRSGTGSTPTPAAPS
jgi:cytochrome d ubiquinol oxidase subunit I